MPPALGRKKKGKKKSPNLPQRHDVEVTPDATTSSPAKAIFSGLITELKFLDKPSKFDRLTKSIKIILESVCENSEEMKEYALFLLHNIPETDLNVDADDAVTCTPLKEPPQVTIIEPVRPIQCNPLAFRPGRTVQAARQYKKRKVDSISTCMEKIGNPQQQLLCLHTFLSRSKANPVVVGAIKALNSSSLAGMVGNNAIELLALANSRRNTKDRRSFVMTLLMAIAPSELPDNSTLSKLSRMLGYRRRNKFTRSLQKAISARKELLSSVNEPFVQQVTLKRRTIFTPAFMQRLHDWILHSCDLVVASPSQKESIIVKDLFSGEKKRVQKHYYVSSVQELHNILILPQEDGGFAEARNSRGDVIISDTTLRSLLPKQLSRLTDSQKQMCGCEICIISREFVKTLSAWMTRIAIQIERDGKIEEARGLKDFVASHQHRKDYIRGMTCDSVNGLSKLQCCLCRCTNCPELVLPDILTDATPSAPVITFQCYECHSYCTIHKSLEGAPTSCSLCKDIADRNKEEERNDPIGKLLRKQHLTKKKKLIGEFISDYFRPMMIKYRFHILHVALLGKHHCVSLRRQMAKETPGSIDTQRDYADALVAEFTNEIQSTHFGENASVSMEGVTVRFGVDSFHYHCYVSDDKRQDARTTHVNQQHLIHHARDANAGLLPPKTGVMFELMDGCAKQYRCGLALYLMSVLSYEKNIIIDRMMSAPHHGKGDCDSQGGIDKNHLRRFFRMTSIPEVQTKTKGIEAHTVKEDGKRASMAERMTEILSSEDRRAGLRGDKKHVKREGNAKIQQRHYHVQHHGNTDSEANAPLKLLNTKFVTDGFSTISGQKQNGLICHYHFLAYPQMGVGTVAARRIPCGCNNCRKTLSVDWVNGLPTRQQPKFQPVVDCKYRDVFGDLNNWRILTVSPRQENHCTEELEEAFEDVLGEHESINSRIIQAGNYGACGAGDEYYILKWTSESYPLQEESRTVEGMGGNALPRGSIVAKGVYWNEVGRAKRWYTPPSRRVQRVFRVRYVIDPAVVMQEPSADVVFPVNRRDRSKVLRLNPLKVQENCHKEIMDELARRARLDYEEGGTVDGVAEEDISGDEDDSEEESSGSEDDE